MCFSAVLVLFGASRRASCFRGGQVPPYNIVEDCTMYHTLAIQAPENLQQIPPLWGFMPQPQPEHFCAPLCHCMVVCSQLSSG